MTKAILNLSTGFIKLRNLMQTILLLFILCETGLQAQTQTDVVKGKWLEYNNSAEFLYRHLSHLAYDQLNKRKDRVDEITSPDDWKKHQIFIRNTLMEIAGPFPHKTSLNPVITRIIEKDFYRLEHIIFESVPGFYVTSTLYVPAGIKGKTRRPAIIYCSGHSAEGYRSDVYQHVILNLVKKGFIVFAFDPVGQGERLEYFEEKTGKSAIGGPTSEHSYPGSQAFLTGISQARYMIWDGIRALDYLLSRKEVDPQRIGITGRSGGGTQSAYIAAIDDRIYAAAPENYITNYTRLLQTIGPQDAEQNIPGIIAKGLDHADFLIVRAPKPAMMITTTSDMFSIQGAMETEEEVSRIYNAFGKAENFSRAEDDAAHASTRKNRESMYAFFQRHLMLEGNPSDEEVKLPAKEELRVTNTGQVSTSFKGETVYSLNLKEAEEQNKKLNELRKSSNYKVTAVDAAVRLSGYADPSKTDKSVFTGRILKDGYTIDKFFIKGEGDYIIPYLLFKPSSETGQAMIWLHPDGKSAYLKFENEIEKFIKQGITILVPDLIGTGEAGGVSLRGDANFGGVSHNLWYASILTGRSITGIQAGDIVKLARLLKSESTTEITGLARKGMSPALLHSAVLSNEITSLILIEPYSSYMAIVRERFYNPLFIMSAVPGALKEYDLPDLEAAFAPRKLLKMSTEE